MNNKEENIAKLEKLFETGIITKKELDAKKMELSLIPTAEELSEMKKLLEEELITEKEFEALKSKGKQTDTKEIANTKPKNKTDDSKGFVKRNIVSLIVIAILVALIGILGAQLVAKQKIVDSLEGAHEESFKYQEIESMYKIVIDDYYIDDYVAINSADKVYYHRFFCPYIPWDDNVRVIFKENAESDGYKKCPKCIDSDVEDYVRKYFFNE